MAENNELESMLLTADRVFDGTGNAPINNGVVLVEGESDAQTLWLHGYPALGLPGASTWSEKRDAAFFGGAEGGCFGLWRASAMPVIVPATVSAIPNRKKRRRARGDEGTTRMKRGYQ